MSRCPALKQESRYFSIFACSPYTGQKNLSIHLECIIRFGIKRRSIEPRERLLFVIPHKKHGGEREIVSCAIGLCIPSLLLTLIFQREVIRPNLAGVEEFKLKYGNKFRRIWPFIAIY